MNIKDKIINRKHKFIKLFFYEELSEEERKYLFDKYGNISLQEICYREINDIIETPHCKYCGDIIPFKNFSEGYLKTCKNSKCRYLNRKDQMFNHFGVENPYQLEYVKEKIKKTNIKKFGVENPSQSEEIKKKKEETCLKHYGVKSGFQTDICKINRKKVKGWINQEKTKNTCLKRYGVENPSQSEEIKKKKEETSLKHWGVTNYWKDPNNRKNFHTKEAHEKEYKTKKERGSFNKSTPEENSYEILKNKYPKIIRQYRSEEYPFNCDFYIPDLNLYIECNYHWTHGGHPYNSNNKQDQDKLKLWKSRGTKFYINAIKTWTIRDINKRNIAINNNLNWIEFFNIEELQNWLNN